MGVVYDEHLVFLLHLKQYQRTRSSPGRMPVTDHVADIAGAVRPDAGQTLLASLRTLRQEWIGTLRSRARCDFTLPLALFVKQFLADPHAPRPIEGYTLHRV
jgi:hypothetical protein